jgi:hypothetical protein
VRNVPKYDCFGDRVNLPRFSWLLLAVELGLEALPEFRLRARIFSAGFRTVSWLLLAVELGLEALPEFRLRARNFPAGFRTVSSLEDDNSEAIIGSTAHAPLVQISEYAPLSYLKNKCIALQDIGNIIVL